MLDRNDTVLVVVDVQERMMPVISHGEEIITNVVKLVRGFRELDIPMLVTEQYTKGLGATVAPVSEAMGEWYRPIEKITFSACADMHFMQQLETAARQNVILCGVETHVCVYQTAMDLLNLGYTVEIVADAVGSRSDRNYEIALRKMTQHGIDLTSIEMILFEMMVRADIGEFKGVQGLVK